MTCAEFVRTSAVLSLGAGEEFRSSVVPGLAFVVADLPPQPESFAENRRRNLQGE